MTIDYRFTRLLLCEIPLFYIYFVFYPELVNTTKNPIIQQCVFNPVLVNPRLGLILHGTTEPRLTFKEKKPFVQTIP